MNRYHHDDESTGGHSRHGHGGPHGAPFGRGGFRPPFGMAAGMAFGGPGGFGPGMRARRGDIRAAVLRLLSEAPMHGYQIIQELSARSEGNWSPSAGSVYPTLQLLADEGLVTSEESGGKKVFSLTDAGKAEVAKTADQPAPWEEAAQSGTGVQGYREAVMRLAGAAMQVGKSGNEDQMKRGIEILTEARKKLYEILAED
jgi:DNA-binding PadR family transcriptional regulator